MSVPRTWIVAGTIGVLGVGATTLALAAENDRRDVDAGERITLKQPGSGPAATPSTTPGPVLSSFTPRSTVTAPTPTSTATPVSAPTTFSAPTPTSAPTPVSAPTSVSPASPVSAPTPDSPASPWSAPSPDSGD